VRSAATLIAGLLIALPLLWIGGEMHRENCLHQGRTHCSVLPWENGKKKPPSGPTRSNPFGDLNGF
jgi:hypothetical protein